MQKPKYKYYYCYNKIQNLFYKIRTNNQDDFFEYKIIHDSFRVPYYVKKQDVTFTQLKQKDFVVLGKLQTLRLLYAKTKS